MRPDGDVPGRVAISTPFIRLDAFLKFCGEADTGGRAKELILQGLVKVDGAVCLQRGRKLRPGTVVTLRGASYEVVSGEG